MRAHRLNKTNRTEFFERGFTRLEGAVPRQRTDAMVQTLWTCLEERHGARPNDPSSWTPGGVRGIGDINKAPEFAPFGSPAVDGAIDQLLGRGNWRLPRGWGQVLVTFPAPSWSWNSLFQGQVDVKHIAWHTDYPYDDATEALSGVQVFCLLADVDAGGGGTLVIEGSHRVVQSFVHSADAYTLAKMSRARKALLASDPWLETASRAISLPRPESWLAEQCGVVNGVDVAVRELTGSAGDVYLTHPWLLHAPSPNCNDAPRMMCTQRIKRETPSLPPS